MLGRPILPSRVAIISKRMSLRRDIHCPRNGYRCMIHLQSALCPPHPVSPVPSPDCPDIPPAIATSVAVAVAVAAAATSFLATVSTALR